MSAGHANMCSCRASRRSSTPTSTRSTPRSSSATTRRLRGRPVIVGGGVVLACSYEAKACGVRTAMGGRTARRAVPATRSSCRRAWRPTPRRAGPCSRCSDDTTPLVEGLSIDEAFLDVGGLRRIAGHAAPRSRPGCGAQVAERVGLPITVGVARTKFLAKVASRVAKPDGLLVVPAGRRAGLPAPAAGRACCGASVAVTAAQAARPRRSRRSATWPGSARPRWSRCSAAAAGRHLHALAHNRDPRRVRSAAAAARSASQRALGRGPISPAALDAVAGRPGRPGRPRRHARGPTASGAP